jgi:transcriptional regulator with XRE-family HTH domain
MYDPAAKRTIKSNGKRIVELRRSLGLTQEQLARKAQLEKRTISGAENGKEKYLSTMLQIATALSVGLEDITLVGSSSGTTLEADACVPPTLPTDFSADDRSVEVIWPYIEAYFMYELGLIDPETENRLEVAQPRWRAIIADLLGVNGGTVRKYLPPLAPSIEQRLGICRLWMETAMSIGQNKGWAVPCDLLERCGQK